MIQDKYKMWEQNNRGNERYQNDDIILLNICYFLINSEISNQTKIIILYSDITCPSRLVWTRLFSLYGFSKWRVAWKGMLARLIHSIGSGGLRLGPLSSKHWSAAPVVESGLSALRCAYPWKCPLPCTLNTSTTRLPSYNIKMGETEPEA